MSNSDIPPPVNITTINHNLPAANCKLPTVNCKPQTANYNMESLNLPYSVIVYTILGLLTIGGTLVAVYVSLTNTISNHKVRVHELETKVARMEATLDEHEDKFVEMFSDIKEGIHRLELQIEKLK